MEAVLRQNAEEMELNSTSQSLQAASDADMDDWAQCMGLNDPEVDVATGSGNALDTEIKDYMSEKNTSKTSSPFIWWAANGAKYPHLRPLAKRFLCPPMGSIASEREFKQAKRVVNGRWNLKASHVEMLLFLKYNLRMIEYEF